MNMTRISFGEAQLLSSLTTALILSLVIRAVFLQHLLLAICFHGITERQVQRKSRQDRGEKKERKINDKGKRRSEGLVQSESIRCCKEGTSATGEQLPISIYTITSKTKIQCTRACERYGK